ncbi:MAG: sigma-70 family RNA polymerase sigma factor [Planctomycetales bacterium]|nr:sigma-70 family RNA polymerase sigma factor [Planctomycetales bacterium]
MTPPASSHRTPAESGANDDPRSSFDSTPDQALVREVLSGESERFGELVRRYEGALRRLAISRGLTTDSADEVVQETFLAAFRYLAGYDERYGFRTWLWTILFNQCRRRQTLESRQPSRLPAEAIEWASFAGTEDPVSAAERSELQGAIARALPTLPEAIADAVRLRYFGEATYPEIAQTQGCCLATAKNRVRAGLDLLGNFFRPRDTKDTDERRDERGRNADE